MFTARRRRHESAQWDRVWCAVEISATVREDDVNRAHQSAEALSAATRNDALAIVAGPSITSDTRALVEKEGVLFAQTPGDKE